MKRAADSDQMKETTAGARVLRPSVANIASQGLGLRVERFLNEIKGARPCTR